MAHNTSGCGHDTTPLHLTVTCTWTPGHDNEYQETRALEEGNDLVLTNFSLNACYYDFLRFFESPRYFLRCRFKRHRQKLIDKVVVCGNTCKLSEMRCDPMLQEGRKNDTLQGEKIRRSPSPCIITLIRELAGGTDGGVSQITGAVEDRMDLFIIERSEARRTTLLVLRNAKPRSKYTSSRSRPKSHGIRGKKIN